MSPKKKAIAVALVALALYLGAESFLPSRHQPSARAALAAVDLYQAVGSPAARKMGFRCRYAPTCSHYAEDAIAHYGTIRGVAKTAGRLFRCAPWGGMGQDPAVPRELSAR